MSHTKLAYLTPNLWRSHYFGHFKVERSVIKVRVKGVQEGNGRKGEGRVKRRKWREGVEKEDGEGLAGEWREGRRKGGRGEEGREGGRKGGRKGGRGKGREGEREGGRKGGREGGRKELEQGREEGREGEREGGREGGMCREVSAWRISKGTTAVIYLKIV